MTRGDFFLLCVQTCVQSKKYDVGFAMVVLQAAADLDAAAYGAERDLGSAAQAFYEWHAGRAFPLFRRPKPAWLEAWEEGQANRVQVRMNEISLVVADAGWWELARLALDDSQRGMGLPFPKGLEPLIDGRLHGLVVSQQQAALFKAWGASLQGWEHEPFSFSEPST